MPASRGPSATAGLLVALQLQDEVIMIRWICYVKVTDRFICNELRKRLGLDYIILDDIITVVQRNRLIWYEHVKK